MQNVQKWCFDGHCQLLWLLRSGKVLGYKVKISIPNPWILKKEEVLANDVR